MGEHVWKCCCEQCSRPDAPRTAQRAERSITPSLCTLLQSSRLLASKCPSVTASRLRLSTRLPMDPQQTLIRPLSASDSVRITVLVRVRIQLCSPNSPDFILPNDLSFGVTLVKAILRPPPHPETFGYTIQQTTITRPASHSRRLVPTGINASRCRSLRHPFGLPYPSPNTNKQNRRRSAVVENRRRIPSATELGGDISWR